MNSSPNRTTGRLAKKPRAGLDVVCWREARSKRPPGGGGERADVFDPEPEGFRRWGGAFSVRSWRPTIPGAGARSFKKLLGAGRKSIFFPVAFCVTRSSIRRQRGGGGKGSGFYIPVYDSFHLCPSDAGGSIGPASTGENEEGSDEICGWMEYPRRNNSSEDGCKGASSGEGAGKEYPLGVDQEGARTGWGR